MKHKPKCPIDDSYTIDNGVGNGYTVYYRRGKSCYTYTVTHYDNGSMRLSRCTKISAEEYERNKNKEVCYG